MATLRALILHNRRLAGLALAIALLLRALVPAGTMVEAGPGHLALRLCGGMADSVVAAPLGTPHRDKDSGAAQHGTADGVCPFSVLAQGSLGGHDPVVLPAPVFAGAFAFTPAPAARRLAHGRHFWPPLRGPPVVA